jgi:biopolymer transport protein ExbB
MKSRLLPLILLALVAVLLIGPAANVAFAQDSAPGSAAAAAAQDNWVTLLMKHSGPCGWIIILLSVVGVALIVEHAVTLRRDKLAPPHIIDEIESLMEEENYQETIELCEAEPGFLTNVVAAALPRVNAGFDAIEQSIQEMGEEETIKLNSKVGWLNLIASIAPLFGLLGTVLGMVDAFRTIATKKGAADPADLAGGIYSALITTVEGLFVGIPTLVGYFYFRTKVTTLVLEIGAIVEQLFDRFRPQHNT